MNFSIYSMWKNKWKERKKKKKKGHGLDAQTLDAKTKIETFLLSTVWFVATPLWSNSEGAAPWTSRRASALRTIERDAWNRIAWTNGWFLGGRKDGWVDG